MVASASRQTINRIRVSTSHLTPRCHPRQATTTTATSVGTHLVIIPFPSYKRGPVVVPWLVDIEDAEEDEEAVEAKETIAEAVRKNQNES